MPFCVSAVAAALLHDDGSCSHESPCMAFSIPSTSGSHIHRVARATHLKRTATAFGHDEEEEVDSAHQKEVQEEPTEKPVDKPDKGDEPPKEKESNGKVSQMEDMAAGGDPEKELEQVDDDVHAHASKFGNADDDAQKNKAQEQSVQFQCRSKEEGGVPGCVDDENGIPDKETGRVKKLLYFNNSDEGKQIKKDLAANAVACGKLSLFIEDLKSKNSVKMIDQNQMRELLDKMSHCAELTGSAMGKLFGSETSPIGMNVGSTKRVNHNFGELFDPESNEGAIPRFSNNVRTWGELEGKELDKQNSAMLLSSSGEMYKYLGEKLEQLVPPVQVEGCPVALAFLGLPTKLNRQVQFKRSVSFL